MFQTRGYYMPPRAIQCANVVWLDLVANNTLQIRLAAYAMINTVSEQWQLQ